MSAAAFFRVLDQILVFLLCVLALALLLGCAADPGEPWRPCRDHDDAVLVITAEGQVIDCQADPDATAPRPRKKKPFGALQ